MSISDKSIQRVVFLVIALIVIFVQIIPVFTSETRELNTLSHKQFLDHLDDRISLLMNDYSIPGASISIIKSGEQLWSKAYGYANIEQERKMTSDAVFRVESISKSVTAWGVMRLVQQGLIDLDTPVQQYLDKFSLPQSEYPEDEITISHLLSHNAGLSLGTIGEEYTPDDEIPGLRDYLNREFKLTHAPGYGFNYSNTGFNLIQLLIEEVTGRNFSDYMAGEVLIPLKMHHSGFAGHDLLLTEIPMGYESEGQSVAPYVYPAVAAGGLFATVNDIARFAAAGLEKSEQQILQAENLQEMYVPRVNELGIYKVVADAYGFGHFIEFLPNQMKAVWHGGQGHGWMSHFHAVPESDDAIVILTNSERSWPFIAHILEDWSRWRGFGPVKFSRITTAAAGLKVTNSLIFLFSIWLAMKITFEFRTGKRKLMFSSTTTILRLAELSVFIAITALLLWSMAQDYLIIESIFPVGSVRLGWGIFLLAIVLLVSILFPITAKTDYSATKSLQL